MINECNVVYDDDFLPKIKIINKYKKNIDDYQMLLPKLKFLNEEIGLKDLAYEKVYALSCDVYGGLKAFSCVSSGDYKEAEISNRNIAMFLVLTGAESAVLIHNHPSDSFGASDDDVEITHDFIDLCNVLNIRYYGSYIVCKSGYVNINNNQKMDWLGMYK